MADRVYAVQANVSGAGCTFSSDVLHAEIRDSKIPRAVYGKKGQQLPETAEDFLRSLIRELGMKVDEVERDDKLPTRPSIPSGPGAVLPATGEIDKLERWISDELPNWLGRAITRHIEKQVDIRSSSRNIVEEYTRNNRTPPDDLLAQANSPEPIFIRPTAWDFAYVVIDDLRTTSYQGNGDRTELKGEVRALIAALVKGKPEATMDAGLRRLRWMFLGYLPDFISAADTNGNGATFETIDPAAFSVAEVLALFQRISLTNLPSLDPSVPLVRTSARLIVKTADTQAGQEPRLLKLQREVNDFSKTLFQEAGN
jgi:hypothetical protein